MIYDERNSNDSKTTFYRQVGGKYRKSKCVRKNIEHLSQHAIYTPSNETVVSPYVKVVFFSKTQDDSA